MFINCLQGLGGHFARVGQNCNYCEVMSTELLSDVVSTKRTLERLFHQCHMFPPGNTAPFQCPGCGEQFNTLHDVEADVAPTNVDDYCRRHAGSAWHRPPLLPIEPIDHIICCLHLLLSLTKLLFKAAILPLLANDEMASHLNEMLRQLGVCIPKQKKVVVDANKSQSQRIKFTGEECLKLLEHWDCIVHELVMKFPNVVEAQAWGEKA